MAAVIFSPIGVLVVPPAVVNRDPHLGRIAVIEAVSAAVVLAAPEILGVIHVGIMIEAVPVLAGVRAAPGLSVGILGVCSAGVHAAESRAAARGQKSAANHQS